MNNPIIYTHELTIKTKKNYEKSVLSKKGVINFEFEQIDNVSLFRSTNGQKFVEVTGTMHLYGYKVENGGFFDLINLTYYPEYSKFVTEGTIKEVKASGIKRQLIRK